MLIKDKNYYIQKFNSLGLSDFRIQKSERTWYKERFQWKITFDFSDKTRGSRYLTPNWQLLLDLFKSNNIDYRRRREYSQNIFTSDPAALDIILDNAAFTDAILYIEYASDFYLQELAAVLSTDTVTDIKFKNEVSEFRYHIFLGGFLWNDTSRFILSNWLAANRELFHFRRVYEEIIDRVKSNSNTPVYDGFNFYAKTPDDILMLHLIAPGKIKKIVKFMEKKHEPITG